MTKLGHFLEARLDRVRPEALLRVGLSPATKVLDLKGRLRCRVPNGEDYRGSLSSDGAS
jgi:hypothetical protein